MKKILVLFLCFSASLAVAQDIAKMSYYAGVGMTKNYAPEDFNKYWREGFNIDAGIGRQIAPRIELQGKITFNSFDLNATNYVDYGDLSISTIKDSLGYKTANGGQTTILSFMLNTKVLFPPKKASKAIPYFTAGIGYSRLHFKEITVQSSIDIQDVPSNTENVLTTGIGIGFDIDVTKRTDLFLEGRFDILLTENKSTVIFPVKFGVAIR